MTTQTEAHITLMIQRTKPLTMEQTFHPLVFTVTRDGVSLYPREIGSYLFTASDLTKLSNALQQFREKNP